MSSPTIADREPLQALDINTRIRKHDGYAVLAEDDRCEVTVASGQVGQADTLDVAAGKVLFSGDEVRVDQQSVQIDAANPNNPRKDVVYLDANGDATVATGTAEAPQPTSQSHEMTERPAPPDLQTTPSVVLAVVWVAAGVSAITQADVLDRRRFADVTYGTVDTTALDIGGTEYVESGQVEPIMTPRGTDRRASTTSTAFVTARGLFTLHLQWDRVPASRSATAVSLRSNPAQHDTVEHRIYNKTDGEVVSGTAIAESSSQSVHTDWVQYTPTSTQKEITLVSQLRTSGTASSEVADVSLWLGRVA